MNIFRCGTVYPAAYQAPKGEEVVYKVRGKEDATCTMEIFSLLISDPDIEYVFSNVTGEVYYYAN